MFSRSGELVKLEEKEAARALHCIGAIDALTRATSGSVSEYCATLPEDSRTTDDGRMVRSRMKKDAWE